MFAKKFLSCIGLLFISSQIFKVSATAEAGNSKKEISDYSSNTNTDTENDTNTEANTSTGADDNDSITCTFGSTNAECNGYYLVESILKTCDETGTCTGTSNSKIGYFYSPAKKFITCTKTNDEEINCTESDPPASTETECDTVGKLIYGGEDGTAKLCITTDAEQAIPITGGLSNDNYFIKVSSLVSNIDDDNKYYMLSLNVNSIEPVDVENETNNKYMYSFDDQKVIPNIDTEQCYAVDGSQVNGLKEYVLNEDDDTYTKEKAIIVEN